MPLPITPPYAPMEALANDELPSGSGWRFEPKWDGFRCLAFRDGVRLDLQSKSGRPLTRYFPEIAEALRALPARRFVLDGEIVIPAGSGLSFDALQQRIHPAASRVAKLALEHPALMVAFDLLVDERGRNLVAQQLRIRRQALERFASAHLRGSDRIRLSPSTASRPRAVRWLARSGRALDGVIAKRDDLPYRSGERDGMVKVKPVRTVDCVVAGFRWREGTRLVGSLLLGLHDQAGVLHHVGFTSGIRDVERDELTRRMVKLVAPSSFTGRAPGGPSRWAGGRSAEWVPVRPELVVEVAYDQVTGERFRHGTRLLRWRLDKAPEQCGLDQITATGHGYGALLRVGGIAH
ncbi:MAG: ATP-dependent DNA ligase [Planctomycetes bacterium]|nr:ATP-dependent DNA ligase [Planctomycetota bacterium]